MNHMSRLIDRNRQIPNGLRFYQPETQWNSQKAVGQFPSFSILTQALMRHRQGNPALVAKYNWATDEASVGNEVDAYNAMICMSMGWTKFIVQGGGFEPAPKSQPLSQIDPRQLNAAAGRVRKIWSGVRITNDWIDSGEPAVPSEVSAARAAICAECPINGKGDFTTWFTIPAAESIKRQIQKVSERNLSTPSDEKLNICTACLCPLKLKVHTPIHFIKPHTSEEVLADLRKNPKCWIVSELG